MQPGSVATCRSGFPFALQWPGEHKALLTLALVLLAPTLLFSTTLAAQASKPSASQVQAAYLYNFGILPFTLFLPHQVKHRLAAQQN